MLGGSVLKSRFNHRLKQTGVAARRLAGDRYILYQSE